MGVRQTNFYKREQMFNKKHNEDKINDKEGREYNDN
jgi:hypothetical protein